MKRIMIPLVVAAGLLGPPAHAATAEAIVAELRQQGYREIEVRRTLLGRTRILAESPSYNREIVLNPSTGVILRDLIRVRDAGDDDGPSGTLAGSGSDNGGSGSSSSGSSGDDSDDDNDDDDSSGGDDSGGDDDNSGSDDSDSDDSGSDDSDSDDSDSDDSGDDDSSGDDSDDDDD